MRFTTTDFANCFMYAGSGTDPMPMLRFSHLTDVFLYVATGPEITERHVLDSFRRKLEFIDSAYPGALRQTGRATHLDRTDFDAAPCLDWRWMLEPDEMRDYEQAFGHHRREPAWSLEIPLERRIGNLVRPLRLVFLRAEALATYAALSHQGRWTPRVFGSIQTGVIEAANGLMARFFERQPTRPSVWLRGEWDMNRGAHVPGRHAPAPCPPYPVRAKAYSYWNSRLSQHSSGFENPVRPWSQVAAFVEESFRPANKVVVGTGPRRVILEEGLPTPDRLAEFDRVWMPQSLLDSPRPSSRGPEIRGIDCQARTRATDERRMGPLATLPEILPYISSAADQDGLRRLALVGAGFEDEGAALTEWVRSSGAETSLTVFAPEPFDWVDLRGGLPPQTEPPANRRGTRPRSLLPHHR